jgi:hypothetical protein
VAVIQLKNVHHFYIDVQNRWMNHLREVGYDDPQNNKWWQLLDAMDACYPNVSLEIARYFRPENGIEVKLWLKNR